jgi:hypothetical protein
MQNLVGSRILFLRVEADLFNPFSLPTTDPGGSARWRGDTPSAFPGRPRPMPAASMERRQNSAQGRQSDYYTE